MYLPAAHEVHAVVPVLALKVPGAHGVQVPAAAIVPVIVPVCPTAHKQSVAGPAPTWQEDSAGHATHTPVPLANLKNPASHGVHAAFAVVALTVPGPQEPQPAPPSLPDPPYPASHSQSVLSAFVTVPPPVQALQSLASSFAPPATALYVSGLQAMHEV